MHTRPLLKAFTFVLFSAAGITWVSGDVGQTLAGRVTIADILGALVVIYALFSILATHRLSLRLPREYKAYFPLLFVFFVGALFAQDPGAAFFELLVHAFVFFVSVALFNLYATPNSADDVADLIQLLLYAGGLLAILGLLHFLFFPTWFVGSEGGLSGTFRNTGQAGTFFATLLAVIIPAFVSRILPWSQINLVLLAVLLIALLFTFKRAAIAGFLVGLALLALQLYLSASKREKKLGAMLLMGAALSLTIIIPAYFWALTNVGGMDWRVQKKFHGQSTLASSDGFLGQNIAAVKRAVGSNPVLGVGLGNTVGNITEQYEIHSTYGAILGEGGFLGLLAYAYFIAIYIRRLAAYSRRSIHGLFLRHFMPFLGGLLISWTYTYHIRKREFWIIFFITSLVMFSIRSATNCRREN